MWLNNWVFIQAVPQPAVVLQGELVPAAPKSFRPASPMYQSPAAQPPYQSPPTQPMYQSQPTQPMYQSQPTQPMYQSPPTQPMYQSPPTQPMYQSPPTQPMYQSLAPQLPSSTFDPLIMPHSRLTVPPLKLKGEALRDSGSDTEVFSPRPQTTQWQFESVGPAADPEVNPGEIASGPSPHTLIYGEDIWQKPYAPKAVVTEDPGKKGLSDCTPTERKVIDELLYIYLEKEREVILNSIQPDRNRPPPLTFVYT